VKIIPAEPTLEHMKLEAEKCEKAAQTEPEPRASALKEKAALLREWIRSLKAAYWAS
jgi:hypothetical protein